MVVGDQERQRVEHAAHERPEPGDGATDKWLEASLLAVFAVLWSAASDPAAVIVGLAREPRAGVLDQVVDALTADTTVSSPADTDASR